MLGAIHCSCTPTHVSEEVFLVQGNAGLLVCLQRGFWTSRRPALERPSDVTYCLVLTLMDLACPPSPGASLHRLSWAILASTVLESAIQQLAGTVLVFQQDRGESPGCVYWLSLSLCTLCHSPLPCIHTQKEDFKGYTEKRTL